MFVFSKLLSAITQPMFWLGLWWACALWMLARCSRAAVAMLWAGLVGLGLLGFVAIPDALLRPLENRYRVPAAETVRSHQGIIVLGGALEHPASYLVHQQVPLGSSAERMTVPVELLRRHPTLQLVFSGGEGRLWPVGVTESALAEVFFRNQGVDGQQLLLEDGSRNTRENAQRVAALLGTRCAQSSWLLVTSAWHMPRAMAEFEAVGCRVIAYPVDFHTGDTTSWTEYSLATSLQRWQTALHEWLGLLVYGWTR